MKLKELLLSVIAGMFFGSTCLGMNCSTDIATKDNTCPPRYISAFKPVKKQFYNVVQSSEITIKPPKRLKIKPPQQLGTYNHTTCRGPESCLIDENTVGSRFYQFVRGVDGRFMDIANPYCRVDNENYCDSICRCSNCGWIGFPKRCNNTARYICRGCARNGRIGGEKALFQVFNNERTTKFGICPYSEPGKPHLGFIHDTRIAPKSISTMTHCESLSPAQLKRDTRTDHFCFYCYECGNHVAVPLNTLGD